VNIVDIEGPEPRAIEARFGGQCASCGERYDAGERIAYSDEDDGWVCEWCA
jgi:hypothetical protein